MVGRAQNESWKVVPMIQIIILLADIGGLFKESRPTLRALRRIA